jgi:hypothetical protein
MTIFGSFKILCIVWAFNSYIAILGQLQYTKVDFNVKAWIKYVVAFPR